MKVTTIASVFAAFTFAPQAYAATTPLPPPLESGEVTSSGESNKSSLIEYSTLPEQLLQRRGGIANAFDIFDKKTPKEKHAHALGLQCHTPGSGNIFVHDPDPTHGLQNVTFNIYTPWTIWYGKDLLQELEYDGWQRHPMQGVQSCVWMPVDKVWKGSVKRGDIAYSMKETKSVNHELEETTAVVVDVDDEALKRGVERIRNAMEVTFPGLEIAILLACTLWVVYVPVICLVATLLHRMVCRIRKRKRQESEDGMA